MAKSDFKINVFKTPEQWKSGLLYRLKIVENGGVTLFAKPGFTDWRPANPTPQNICELAVDGCGLVYFVDQKKRWLMVYDPVQETTTPVVSLADLCDWEPSDFDVGRIVFDPVRLWILDEKQNRAVALCRRSWRLRLIIDDFVDLNDIAVDRRGRLHALDIGRKKQIRQYAHDGGFIRDFAGAPKEAVSLAIGRDGRIFVLDERFPDKFLNYDSDGDNRDPVWHGFEPPKGWRPLFLTANNTGDLFVTYLDENENCRLHQFDPAGVHLGEVELPPKVQTVSASAFGAENRLHLATERGVAFYGAEKRFVDAPGFYYSKTLDNADADQPQQWHRLDLDANVPDKTTIRVSYATSSAPGVRRQADKIIADKSAAPHEKTQKLDQILQWTEPEKTSRGLLFRENTGRFLWLKLELRSLDSENAPEIRKMNAVYPRKSYLRYLPPFFQENAQSRDFLERFLALFETVLCGLEDEIEMLFEHFDPKLAPENFLNWLACWLNLALEEAWPEERKRALIAEAWELYQKKGTPEGITRFIRLTTGVEAKIIELDCLFTPFILAKRQLLALGINTIIPSDDLPLDHRFAVSLALSKKEFEQKEAGIRRVIDEMKPAHTTYHFRLACKREYPQYLGFNTRLDRLPELRIDGKTRLGYGRLSGESV